jgi:hypothetical protein
MLLLLLPLRRPLRLFNELQLPPNDDSRNCRESMAARAGCTNPWARVLVRCAGSSKTRLACGDCDCDIGLGDDVLAELSSSSLDACFEIILAAHRFCGSDSSCGGLPVLICVLLTLSASRGHISCVTCAVDVIDITAGLSVCLALLGLLAGDDEGAMFILSSRAGTA